MGWGLAIGVFIAILAIRSLGKAMDKAFGDKRKRESDERYH